MTYQANLLTRNVFGDIHKVPMFTATGGPTSVPLLVLGCSVGVVVQ